MPARLKSGIWVHALLRRAQVQGLFGAVVRHGADEAGAVYVVINHLDGTYDLLGPPPGPAHDDEGERRFERLFDQPRDWQAVDAIVAKRQKSDPDIWVVEIEDRESLAGLSPEELK